jgi:hypothetical protein
MFSKINKTLPVRQLRCDNCFQIWGWGRQNIEKLCPERAALAPTTVPSTRTQKVDFLGHPLGYYLGYFLLDIIIWVVRSQLMNFKLSRSAFLMKKAYHSTSDFLVYHKYGHHCSPNLFVLNLCSYVGFYEQNVM